MFINSTIFMFLMLPLLLGIYFILRKTSYRNIFLFVVNIILYAFGEPIFILLLVGSMLINYLLALGIDKYREQNKHKRFMVVGVVFNLLLLFFFKYFMSLNNLFNMFIALFGAKSIGVLRIAMPIGISFYTFQAISYIVDVYRADIKAQRNFIKFGVYFSFFAQIVAGPIVRYKDIHDQIENRPITLDSFCQGLKRFLIGLGQKVIFATYFAKIADTVFSNPASALGGATAWVGIFMYALQIYFDFAGYSSMAIGMAKMLGFDYKENFDHPYISSSIKEFWRRWHISLSSWFRDYVYIPMGGNRKGLVRMYIALFTTFVLSGVWHGSSLPYLVWGVWHGLFIILEKLPPIKKLLDKTPRVIKHIYTLFIVLIGWVFFRSPNIVYAFEYLGSMLFIHGWAGLMPVISWATIILAVFGVVGCTPLLQYIKQKIDKTENKKLINAYTITVYTLLIIVMVACIPILLSGTASPFIYAQF